MPVKRLHHINFVVRDLAAAIKRYEEELGLPSFETVDHTPRGAQIARSRVGDTWFVLVRPYDASSIPGRHLEEHGEGFFLLSFGSDDFDASLAGISGDSRGEIREGILNWKVADIGCWFGADLQLTDDN